MKVNLNLLQSQRNNINPNHKTQNNPSFGAFKLIIDGEELIHQPLKRLHIGSFYLDEPAMYNEAKKRSAEVMKKLFKKLDKIPSFKEARENASENITVHASKDMGVEKRLFWESDFKYLGEYIITIHKNKEIETSFRIQAKRFKKKAFQLLDNSQNKKDNLQDIASSITKTVNRLMEKS